MEHINFNRAAILVEPTEFRGLKSEESAAEVQIDPALAEELRQFMPKAGEPRFILTRLNWPDRVERCNKVGIRVPWMAQVGVLKVPQLWVLRAQMEP